MGAEVTLSRRDLIAAGVIGAATLAWPAGARVTPARGPESVELSVGQRRTVMSVWRARHPRGLALFSHGHGSWPERYAQLAAMLTADGWTVLAPMHVDSIHYPERASFTLHQSFPERLVDMAAARRWADAHAPRLPVVAVGHSFGTLTALCMGGALAGMGPFRDPAVRAVLGFSTPGRIPGLIGPTAYAGVAVPVMIVTGTADTVPGFVTDPADHLFPAQTVPTDSYVLVVNGADHGLVAGPGFARAEAPARLFVDGYGREDRRARARLAAYRAAPGDNFTVRKAPA